VTAHPAFDKAAHYLDVSEFPSLNFHHEHTQHTQHTTHTYYPIHYYTHSHAHHLESVVFFGLFGSLLLIVGVFDR
jgi:hypothetical protein